MKYPNKLILYVCGYSIINLLKTLLKLKLKFYK